MTETRALSWFGIIRLGLVQTALGAIVVLTTSTLNRIMVVEVALPAIVPGLLVAWHYALQVFRPRLGYGSDVGGRRTPWIVGGMIVLASGGVLASIATGLMMTNVAAGFVLALTAFTLIGLGVGACGTTLLVLLAKRTDERRRPAAATIVWVMMIAGFIVTAGAVGHLLDPFSPARLIAISSVVAVTAVAITIVAVWNIEGGSLPAGERVASKTQPGGFRASLMEVWKEPQSRRFAIFIFVSMIAYSAQDLILEPFAGLVFGFSPGESTKLSGIQNAGVLAGMVLVALASTAGGIGSLKAWTIGGCIASALALFGLTAAAIVGQAWPLVVSVFALGLANGAYAVAAIGSMMGLVGIGGKEGVRMGLWGAAQAIAFGAGGIVGTGASDLARALLGSPAAAYGTVFAAEGALFVVAAVIAMRIESNRAPRNVEPDCSSPLATAVAKMD